MKSIQNSQVFLKFKIISMINVRLNSIVVLKNLGLSIKILIYLASLFVTISFSLNAATSPHISKIIPLENDPVLRSLIAPVAIAVNAVTNRIYVDVGYIYVVDGNTNSGNDIVRIENNIAFPIRGMGVNAITNRFYVIGNNGIIIMIDGAKDKIVDSTTVWEGTSNVTQQFPSRFTAEGLAVNSITNRIYVTHFGNQVSVINGINNRVIDTITLAKLENIQGIEVNPLTNRIYVAGSNALGVIDGKTNKVIDTIKVEGKEVDVNPVTNRIYVAGSVITIIDGEKNKIIDTVMIGSAPIVMEINPATNRYYAVSPNHDIFSVIDGTTNKVIDTLKIGINSAPHGITVNPATNLIYVTRHFKGDVVVIKDEPTNRRILKQPDMGKLFKINCTHNLQTGAAGLEKLVLNSSKEESCVLKLKHLESGVPIEVTTNLMTVLQSAIKVNPEMGITDANGELEFTISAVRSGEDWIEWAALNENGEFDFSKEAYEAGTAWGMFVEVR